MKILSYLIMKVLWVACIVITILGSLYAIVIIDKASTGQVFEPIAIVMRMYALLFALTSALVPYCVCRAVQMLLKYEDFIDVEKVEKSKKIAKVQTE